MSQIAPYLAHGTFEGWGPSLRSQKRIGSLDTLQGTYISSHPNAVRLGFTLPEYPAMFCVDVQRNDDGCGSYEYRVQGEGNLEGQRPEKFISDRKTRSSEVGWDSSQRDLYHDAAEELVGQTDTTYNGLVDLAHRFRVGDPVKVLTLGGSCGLAAGTVYFVQSVAGMKLKLSATLGGAAVTITGNVAVRVVHRDFALGAVHPKYPGMFLADVDTDDDEVLPWSRCRLRFLGIYGNKTYKRSITVNGRTISKDSLIVNLPGGGWSTARKGTAQQPTIEVSDIQPFAADPDLYVHVPTSDVLNVAEEERTIPTEIVIPDPPDINAIFGDISGDVTSQWPNHWAFVGCERVDSIPGTTVVMIRKVWRYEWPLTL